MRSEVVDISLGKFKVDTTGSAGGIGTSGLVRLQLGVDGESTDRISVQLNKIDTCAVEMQQLCADIPDEGEKQQCHKDRRTELSAGCQAAAGD